MAGKSLEILSKDTTQIMGAAMCKNIGAVAEAAGWSVRYTGKYEGKSELLMLYGVGHDHHNLARTLHVAEGGRALLWDLGYFHRERPNGHLRLSIDSDHPHKWVDATPPRPDRWNKLRIDLQDQYAHDGRVLLVGMGVKSMKYLGKEYADWMSVKADSLRARYAYDRILHRPKPGKPFSRVGLEVDATSPINVLLEGAALVVCRHSNVAVDAVRVNVPIEVEDGIAFWLRDKKLDLATRLDFFYRLAWWQWRPTEAKEAFEFIKFILGEIK